MALKPSARSWSSVVVVLLVAALAFVLGFRSSPEAPVDERLPPSPAVVSERAAPPTAAAPAQGAAVATLEARLAELSGRLAALEGARSAPPRSQTPEDRAAEAKQLTEQYLVELQTRVSEHHASRLDGAWSAEATRRIEQDLQPLLSRPDNRATVEKIDCRSSSCITTLRFDSRDEALAHYEDFVTSEYHVPCATTALLPERDASGTVKVDVLFFSCSTG